MFFYDPTFLLLIPALILAFWAQIKVSSAFSQYSRIRASVGLTGSQLAMRLLEIAGIYNVRVEAMPGHLTDHYDPRNKVVRLSSSTYASQSIAALGVVAHEIGHAIQDAQKHPLLVFRTILGSRRKLGFIAGVDTFHHGHNLRVAKSVAVRYPSLLTGCALQFSDLAS